jgi:hypothetical protein
MDEDILVIIVSAVTVLAGMGVLLTGWGLWLRHRTERLRGGSSQDIRALQDSVAALRTEMETMYGELTQGHQELHERIDFAERLLTQEQGKSLSKGDRPGP